MTANLVYSDVTCRVDVRRKRAAVEEFSLECSPGEITCLLGPNGAGKTTALACAAALIEVDHGTIEFEGKHVAPSTPLRSLGYLPQQSAFPAVLTVREVMDFAFSARRTSVPSRGEILFLTGLEDVMDETTGRLSSGWLRRLGLAVSLAPPSRLLLLDEPFVGLDLDILDSTIVYLTRRASEGATVVLSTHDFEIVDQLDARVAVLDDGKLRGVVRIGNAQPGARSLYRSILSGVGLPPVTHEAVRSDA